MVKHHINIFLRAGHIIKAYQRSKMPTTPKPVVKKMIIRQLNKAAAQISKQMCLRTKESITVTYECEQQVISSY